MKVRLNSLHALALILAALLLGPIGAVAGIQMLRLRDARPALGPLRSLRAEVSSAPVAFSRQCAYFVWFDAESSLDDSNAATLLSLNRLAKGNSVFLCIETPRVTDGSLDVIVRLERMRRLDLRQSGTSDEGIARVRSARPEADVWDR